MGVVEFILLIIAAFFVLAAIGANMETKQEK